MAKAKKEAAPKKLNIYKVMTIIHVDPGNPDADTVERTDYVRAKTSAGAAKIVKEKAVAVTSIAVKASQEDLLALAKVAVLGEQAGI